MGKVPDSLGRLPKFPTERETLQLAADTERGLTAEQALLRCFELLDVCSELAHYDRAALAWDAAREEEANERLRVWMRSARLDR